MINLEECTYERDDKGELIPQEVELIELINGEKKKAFLTPLTRGELKKTFAELGSESEETKKDKDGEIILKHCSNPKFTE